VDDLLAWIAFLFTTYSMVSTGFITVLAWDSLTFDRRDAMTLVDSADAYELARRMVRNWHRRTRPPFP